MSKKPKFKKGDKVIVKATKRERIGMGICTGRGINGKGEVVSGGAANSEKVFHYKVLCKNGQYWYIDEQYLKSIAQEEPLKDTGFKKFDQGKPKMTLMPQKALMLCAEIMTMGEQKYGSFNYMNGSDWRRCLDAAHRHMNSWLNRESIDPESGKSHLAHAACSLLMVLEMELRGTGKDDRYDPEKGGEK